jgi:ATP-dependent protease ClpP protease subunit
MSDVTFTLPASEEVVELAKRKMTADLEKVQAERDAQRALASQWRSQALIDKLKAEETTLSHRIEMTRDFHHHVYRFLGPVTEDSAEAAIVTLSSMDRLDSKASWEIVFNSPGGSVIDGMDLYDFIQEMKRKGHYIVTAARGYAASMGGILLQAGNKRVMGKEAYVLIHEISLQARGKTSAIEDDVAFSKKMQERVLSIFESRSAEAFRNGTSKVALTAEQISHGDPELGIPGWSRREWWCNSDEALDWGLVDEVR